MKKKLLALVAVLTLCFTMVFGLTACGNDNGATNTNTNKKVIKVGYTLNKPMNYKDANGKLIGFDTELAQAVFEALGYKVQFQQITWSNKYMELEGESIDCVWNGFTCNATESDGRERNQIVDFSYKYMTNKQVVVVKKSSALKGATTLTAFASSKGAYENGSSGQDWANDSFPQGTKFTGLDAQIDALNEVASGAADFAVVDVLLAAAQCGSGAYADLQIVEGVKSLSNDEYYAVGFKKGSDLTAKVNAKLVEFEQNGKLAQIAGKYGLVDVLKPMAEQANA